MAYWNQFFVLGGILSLFYYYGVLLLLYGCQAPSGPFKKFSLV